MACCIPFPYKALGLNILSSFGVSVSVVSVVFCDGVVFFLIFNATYIKNCVYLHFKTIIFDVGKVLIG